MNGTRLLILGAGFTAWFAGCGMSQDSTNNISAKVSEFERQALEFNRRGEDEKAVASIEEALRLRPDDSILLEQKGQFLWNATAQKEPTRFLAYCDEILTRGVGDEVLFRVWKAQILHDMGTEWIDGHARVVDESKCRQAIAELRRAHSLNPNVVRVAEEKEWVPMGWDEHFDGLLSLPECQDVFDN